MGTVAILDSGVGGLSVYKEIVKKCPGHCYVFVSDNDAFPYGTKTELALIERVQSLVERIVDEFHPDILVIACNTASTVVLPILRDQYSFPIVGVVPAIKPAAKLSKTKKIGLLATPGTIARQYTQSLIDQFAGDCDVVKVGSSELVELAESKLNGDCVSLDPIKQQLRPLLLNKNIDVVVLACTHFPLLNNEIECIFNKEDHIVSLVDSGQAIANRVSVLLEGVMPSESEANSMAVFTEINNSEPLAKYLSEIGLSRLGHLEVLSI